jgi:hypothetical protein
MEILNTYFDTLVFYWVEEKQNQAVYVASVAGMLGGDKMRCIIAFVPAHLGIVAKSKLRDLPWKNLQMRTVPVGTYKTFPQKWKAPTGNSSTTAMHSGAGTTTMHGNTGIAIPDITLKVINRDKNYSTCVSITEGIDFPFEVLLIHSPKKNSIYQFPNTMNLHWAIDQFCTVFNLYTLNMDGYTTNTIHANTFIQMDNINTNTPKINTSDKNNDVIEWIL